MTPNPSDEAIHFRGKTLTPESPRPLHIPEPSNIPVLENQMDPIFNDTSTYEKHVNNSSEEQTSQLHVDNAVYKSVEGSENELEEAGRGLPSQSDLANFPTTMGTQSTFVNTAPSAEHNAAPFPHHGKISPEQTLSTNNVDGAQSQIVKAETGIDFQNLLDNLSSSSSSAPSGPGVTVAASSHANNPVPQESEQPPLLIPSTTYAGLPPRPPAQEVAAVNNHFPSLEDNSGYHRLFTQASSSPSYVSRPQGESQYSNSTAFVPVLPPGTSSGVNGLPPPPIPTFQQHQTPQRLDLSQEGGGQASHKGSRTDRYGPRSGNAADDEAPWGPEVQKIYDEFLREERVYVTEGLWDRFPPGSRLFVGNLPTERVTKRDLFHVFHKYGKLAQISIKQAYGFIQFLDASSCHQALQAEQGGIVRGRKIHLEISKPQNTRPGPGHSDSTRAPLPRRSRSPPDYTRGGTSGSREMRNPRVDRHDRSYDAKRGNFGDFRGRDEHSSRRRDDYRPPRSSSPRQFRNREGGFRSRDRTPERFERRDRRRSRSPYARDRRFRSPSPRARPGYEGESELAFSRRAPRDVPDLQILAADDVEMSFVYHVENTFKGRGLRTNVLVLSRIPVDVAIQRQMEEGVFAVITITRSQQYSGKVTLLLFDRSVGAGNKPRSMEYSDLDLHVAVDMTVQFHSVRRAGVTQSFLAPNPAFPVSPPSLSNHYTQAMPHLQPVIPAASQPNQLANLISTLDGPALQSLLSTLQQAQSVAQAVHPSLPAPPNPTNPIDLGSLLNAHRQQNQSAPAQNPTSPQLPAAAAAANPFGLPLHAQLPNRPDPNLLALLAKSAGNGRGQPQVGAHVQNIVNQLAKWKQ